MVLLHLDRRSVLSMLRTSRSLYEATLARLYRNVVLSETHHVQIPSSQRPQSRHSGWIGIIHRLSQFCVRLLRYPSLLAIVNEITVLPPSEGLSGLVDTPASHLSAEVRELITGVKREATRRWLHGYLKKSPNSEILLALLLPRLANLKKLNMFPRQVFLYYMQPQISRDSSALNSMTPFARLQKFTTPSSQTGDSAGLGDEALALLLQIPSLRSISVPLSASSSDDRLRGLITERTFTNVMIITFRISRLLPRLFGSVIALAPNLRSLSLEWSSVNVSNDAFLGDQLSPVLIALSGTLEILSVCHDRLPGRITSKDIGLNRGKPGPLANLVSCLQLKSIHLSMPFLFGLTRDILFCPMELDQIAHRDMLDLTTLQHWSPYLTSLLPGSIQHVSLVRHDSEKFAALVLNVEELVAVRVERFPRLMSITIRLCESGRFCSSPYCDNDFYTYAIEETLPELRDCAKKQGVDFTWDENLHRRKSAALL